MRKSLTHKVLESRLLEGSLKAGEEIKIKVNQTLTQDSTGTMVYLQLEKMGIKEIKTDFSVAYIDHNTIQSGFENADDHAFIQSVCEKYGIIYSKPGNGICHQLNFERFGKPGNVLLGSDSHTPTGGGLGMIAIGAGGLDVAVAMATGTYTMKMPKVFNVYLEGSLPEKVSAKDVILEVLRLLSVKGGVGYVIEYSGPGVKSLSATDRGTITNMGAELGATTSIFPSDENTKQFLEKQGRLADYTYLAADEDAYYDKKIVIDLSSIKPLVAKPHSPDHVDTVESIKGLKVDQVAIGSCTNSSYTDLMKVAQILKNNSVHPNVSLVISPGSSNILKMLSENGALGTMIAAGARILEASCGPCIGMGQAPKTDAVSLRTFNRNFKGRCGTKSADVYLVSPETATISAITGKVTPSTAIDSDLAFEMPNKFDVYDHYFIFNEGSKLKTPIEMGPNIKPFPSANELPEVLEAPVVLKTGDNITTDDIMPSNAYLLPYRSNIPKLSNYAFNTIIPDFKERAERLNGGIVIGGENYGQGSSREHAALVPLYLGIKAIVAKSFARIHRDNLINVGIIPFIFKEASDYERISDFDTLLIEDVDQSLLNGLSIKIKGKDISIPIEFDGSAHDLEVLKAGGYLKYAIQTL